MKEQNLIIDQFEVLIANIISIIKPSVN